MSAFKQINTKLNPRWAAFNAMCEAVIYPPSRYANSTLWRTRYRWTTRAKLNVTGARPPIKREPSGDAPTLAAAKKAAAAGLKSCARSRR